MMIHMNKNLIKKFSFANSFAGDFVLHPNLRWKKLFLDVIWLYIHSYTYKSVTHIQQIAKAVFVIYVSFVQMQNEH